MNCTITFTNQPSTNELEKLCKGLDRHAKQTIGKTSFEPFGFLAHNSSGALIGGCTGVLMYGTLCIKLLWIEENARGNGLGRKLIEKAELFARENACRYITLETFGWQAKDFYEKMHYKIEHVYNGYDDEAKFYFFRKKL